MYTPTSIEVLIGVVVIGFWALAHGLGEMSEGAVRRIEEKLDEIWQEYKDLHNK